MHTADRERCCELCVRACACVHVCCATCITVPIWPLEMLFVGDWFTFHLWYCLVCLCGLFILDCDGFFLSNGPGDPSRCDKTIDNIRTILGETQPKPMFGICLGHQLMALASGGTTFKMK